MMRKVHAYVLGGGLLFGSLMPAMAQDDRGGNYNRDQNRRSDQNRGNNQNRGSQNGGNDNRGNSQRHANYYSGMNDRVRQGDYGRSIQEDESRHHHESGGIGPGKAALIGGAGGAALGAIFGGGLKGTLIGGAAGAGIGAIGGKLAQGNDHNRNGDRNR